MSFDQRQKYQGVESHATRQSKGRVDYRVLPVVEQRYPVYPSAVVDTYFRGDNRPSTAKDYEPIKKDVKKKQIRAKRAKNVVIGLVMFLLSAFSILPYILGAVGVQLEHLPLNFVPDTYNAINTLVMLFKDTFNPEIEQGLVAIGWLASIPSLIIILGILFVVINMIKSILAIFVRVKPTSYTICAFVYCACVIIPIIISACGLPELGVEQVDIISEFSLNWQTTEFIPMLIFAVGYFIFSFIFSILGRDRQGY